MKEELKPCPFCGGKAKIEKANNYSFWVHCTDYYCSVELPAKYNAFYTSRQNAKKAWNHRTDTRKERGE